MAPLQGVGFGGAFTQGGAHGGVGRGDLAYKSDESDESDASDASIGCSGVGAPASLPAYNQLR
ncbi:MAG: hypothetical protein PHG44_06675 [Lentisphaeria bacterium]|nr:hypothetical protein [Lentisphaeria bacterium]